MDIEKDVLIYRNYEIPHYDFNIVILYKNKFVILFLRKLKLIEERKVKKR